MHMSDAYGTADMTAAQGSRAQRGDGGAGSGSGTTIKDRYLCPGRNVADAADNRYVPVNANGHNVDRDDRVILEPASERDTTARLRLVSKTGWQSDTAHASPGSLLQLAHSLSQVLTKAEISRYVQEFLNAHLGECSVHLGSADPTEAEVLHRVDGSNPIAGSPAITRVDGRFRIELPLSYRGVSRGRFIIDFDREPALSPATVELLELIGFSCSAELSRLANSRAVDDHVSDLTFIRRLEQQISRASDVRSMGDLIQNELSTVIDCTFFSLLTVHDDPSSLEVIVHRNVDGTAFVGLHVPIEGSRVGQVFNSGQPLLIDNILVDDGAYGRQDATWRSLMIAPLGGGQQTFGVVMVGHKLPSLYSERDLRIVELTASHVANAIYRLIEDERDRSQYRAAIEALSAAVDARDPFTHTHSRRVAELARRLAIRLDMSEKEVEQIELAGLLHDIGKIGIPDRILTKPGPLDAEERLVMMDHAEMGARIIGSSPTLSELTPMVRHHHEWFDGCGYPTGMRGDEIPLSAAILSVADALETMTSNRVYRSALKVPQARQELIDGRGSQFHPGVVDAMVALIDSDPVVRQMVSEVTGELNESALLAPIRASDVVDLRVMTRIAGEIGTLTEIDSFLNHVHSIVREELDLADVIIWLTAQHDGTYVLASGETDLPPPEQLAESSVQILGSHLHSQDAIVLGRDSSSGLADRTMIFPMYVEDSQIGLIELVLNQPGFVDGRDVDLLQAIAAPVASTVRVAQLHDEAKRAATIDGLTGVLNHRAFYQELDHHMDQLADGEAICLLIVDVIGLKAINDNYGHLAGDTVLRTVARAIVERVRDCDIVARYGGDEFVAILRGTLDTPLVRLIARIEEPVTCRFDTGDVIDVRLRCGSASSMDNDVRATELVARADSLLYRRHQPTMRTE